MTSRFASQFVRSPGAARVAALGVAALVGIGHAHASLVTNGGFESGDFSGWTVTGGHWNGGGIIPGSSIASGPIEGTYSLYKSSPYPKDELSQLLSTVAGQEYDVSFTLKYEEYGLPSGSTFFFGWNGLLGDIIVNQLSFGPTNFLYHLTATSASTEILFSFATQTGAWYLDAVSVEAKTSAIPEPSSLALAGMALAILFTRGAARRSMV